MAYRPWYIGPSRGGLKSWADYPCLMGVEPPSVLLDRPWGTPTGASLRHRDRARPAGAPPIRNPAGFFNPVVWAPWGILERVAPSN